MAAEIDADFTLSQDIVQKACAHFRLCTVDDIYVLVGAVNGTELEVTDDTLKYLSEHAVVTLFRLPHACDADEDETSPTEGASTVWSSDRHTTHPGVARYVPDAQ